MRFTSAFLLLSALGYAQTPAGKWISNLKFFDQDNYGRMEFEVKGSKLSGKLSGDTIEGTFKDGTIKAKVKANAKEIFELEGRVDGDRITGTAHIAPDQIELKWQAQRDLSTQVEPKSHTFEPTAFHHHFSSATTPALRINPGDTVKTWSVDAGGSDAKGVRITSGGNPLTGPFYVEGALPGDVLAVHFNRIRLNRDTAISSPLIVNSAVNANYVENRKKVEDYNADWKLDRAAGFAMLQKPTAAMKEYKVPLAPMLGCVGVAPPGQAQFRSGYLGAFGGNMDYNQLREGVTVYLPVFTPGALLFVGDGHAVQGAGELTGNALETSMDIEFTVDLQRGASSSGPRFENAEFLMASGIAGSLDDAFRGATTNMVRWIEKSYGLNPAEASSVLSTSIAYDIAEVVDPQVHVVARVPKSALAGLKPLK